MISKEKQIRNRLDEKIPLSRVQKRRLGGIIAVLSGREPVEEVSEDLLSRGFIKPAPQSYIVTNDGLREKDRLSTLAGIYVQKSESD
tara:strand:+ start:836 stop:1096 length:261 start_codon:yes stop_codon:yes gene_type:complete